MESTVQMEIDNLTPSSFKNGKPVSSSFKPPIRTRNRKPLSCNHCRQQKIKCNRKKPCDSCTRYHRDCSYGPGSSRQDRRRSSSNDQDKSINSMKSRDNDQSISGSENNVHIQVLVHGNPFPVPSSGSSPGQDQWLTSGQGQNDKSRGNRVGYASYKDKNVKFKGPSHWASITSKVRILVNCYFMKANSTSSTIWNRSCLVVAQPLKKRPSDSKSASGSTQAERSEIGIFRSSTAVIATSNPRNPFCQSCQIGRSLNRSSTIICSHSRQRIVSSISRRSRRN